MDKNVRGLTTVSPSRHARRALLGRPSRVHGDEVRPLALALVFEQREERPSAEFYVGPNARLIHPLNIWVHEYVHTRQAALSPRWMSEGAAMFFTAQISIEQGWVTPRRYDGFFANQTTPNGTLRPGLPYEKAVYHQGTFFYMQVSHEFRETNYSLEDIYRRLNQRSLYESNEEIQAKDFEHTVEEDANLSVSYEDPMEKPVPVRYFIGPKGLPHSLREIIPNLDWLRYSGGTLALLILLNELKKLFLSRLGTLL